MVRLLVVVGSEADVRLQSRRGDYDSDLAWRPAVDRNVKGVPPPAQPLESPSPRPAPGGADERPSKTQRKHQMHELQRLGERLVALAPQQLARIDLPDALREQIELARRIRAREGLRRQLQYIGRLMRSQNVSADSIRSALARIGATGGAAR